MRVTVPVPALTAADLSHPTGCSLGGSPRPSTTTTATAKSAAEQQLLFKKKREMAAAGLGGLVALLLPLALSQEGGGATTLSHPQAPGPPLTMVFPDGEAAPGLTGYYYHYGIPALTVSPQGNLLAFCQANLEANTSAAASSRPRLGDGNGGWVDIALRRSTDAGATWGPSFAYSLISHAQGSSGVVGTVPFAWRGHTKRPTTRARPSPDLAVWLE